MKKKIALFLSMLFAAALMLGACGKDSGETGYNGKTESELEESTGDYAYQVATGLSETLGNVLVNGVNIGQVKLSELKEGKTVREHVKALIDLMSEQASMNSNVDESQMEAEKKQMEQQYEMVLHKSGMEQKLSDYLVEHKVVSQPLIDAAISFDELKEKYGDCTNITYTDGEESTPQGIKLDDIKITKAGDTLTTDTEITLKKDDTETKMDFQVVYDYNTMTVTGISIDPVQTMGQKMARAGMNTVISMAIVFSVLILISLIIAAFNIFPWLEKRKKEKAMAANAQMVELRPAAFAPQASAAPGPVQTRQETAEVMDDTELIAVIAAAIAAGTGVSTNDFVVRSINRR